MNEIIKQDFNDQTIKRFTARSIWRMKQFYETYKDNEKLSTLLTQISWSNNLLIMSASKTKEYLG